MVELCKSKEFTGCRLARGEISITRLGRKSASIAELLMSTSAFNGGVVNCLGAPWPEDLSTAFIDQLLGQDVAVVGCTANLTWDDTIESIENFEIVKAIVREHPQAYILRSGADLDREENRNKVGVLLGLQNPKALSDSLGLLDAFFDLGLRCLSLAFSENSYYGCGHASEVDSGLTSLGRQAIKRMNQLGIVIDLSHSGDRTALEALELSEQPVIFSHSTSRALFNRPRSAPDPLIVAAAKKGGVICQDVRANTSVGEVCRLGRLLRQARRRRSHRRGGPGRLSPLLQRHQAHRAVSAVLRGGVQEARLERRPRRAAQRHRRQIARPRQLGGGISPAQLFRGGDRQDPRRQYDAGAQERASLAKNCGESDV